MEFFKGDDQEVKFYEVSTPMQEQIKLQKNLFFDEIYEARRMGELIYDSNRSPLANVIDREIFVSAFKEIFDAFVVAGTFEGYLTVFRKIFGSGVVVEFEVPAPGKLNIDIEAAGVELSTLLSRTIVDNEYIFEPITDHEGNPIEVQTLKGFTSQYELEKMLFEMVPGGIYTVISLTLGV